MIGLEVNGYQIEKFLGNGAFGTVYRCTRDSANYAIKIFSSQYVFDEYQKNESHNRITQEVDALRRVDHDNIVQVCEFGSFYHLEVKYYFIIMEFIEGQTLKELINKRGTPNIGLFKSIATQLIIGISHLHKNNIIHRDLKPENIFLASSGTIKIVDFGLSKMIDFSSITSTGTQIGSPLYMSPEQVSDSKNIDYRSDYYSYGVILFELLTGRNPYGRFSSREELFYKILHDNPLSVLQFDPSIPNSIDNLLNRIMSKTNYTRPNSPEEITDVILNWEKAPKIVKKLFEPTFFLRLYNEKTVLTEYYKDLNKVDFCIFPINLQSNQKGLLKFIKQNIPFIIDPSTLRLAYDTFSDVKGLVDLPYAPKDYTRLEVSNFEDYGKKKRYVELVLLEQLKHKPDALLSPFHFSNNSTDMTIKSAKGENWFSLDVKFLKESKSYMIEKQIKLPLVGGFAIHSNILTSKEEQEFFLNTLSSLPCDQYLIYVDCIDYNSNAAQVYQYIKTLYLLQKNTNKPVIAGRINSLGLVLLSFGLYGFESGAARFESFYEELYKDKRDPFNMYVMYYIPELLKNVAIKRKDPSKIFDIIKNEVKIDIGCQGPYCKDKPLASLLVDKETKKHFIYQRQKEVKLLKSLPIPERITHMEGRISKAIEFYDSLRPVFKADDYAFLKTWKTVIRDLRKELAL